MRRPRRRFESTRGDFIHDESREGYVLDRKDKIRGQVKNYDPYSRFGEVMLYDIDEFGYVPGYISVKWRVMSEEDIAANKKLAKRLRQTKYQTWKRLNIDSLLKDYDRMYRDMEVFEKFCVEIYKKTKPDEQ